MSFPGLAAVRRVVTWSFASLLVIGVAGLDIGAAAPHDLTSNLDNSVSTLVVDPPGNVAATSTPNLLPLLTCSVTVTWTAPDMTGIGGYEVRRVLADGGLELAGPWTTTDQFYIDDRAPLALLGTAFAYQVRTILGDTTWRSDWVTADTGLSILCLDGSNELLDRPALDGPEPVDIEPVATTSLEPVAASNPEPLDLL